MNKCQHCQGEGKVANSADQEPWSMWENLPPQSKMAIYMGLVKPMICSECNGSGKADRRSEESNSI